MKSNRLTGLVNNAYNSKYHLKLLNLISSRMIPFNQPHSFRIKSISQNEIIVTLPYKRKNLNHIKGIHACALATLSEYATGMLLISRLDPKNYRLIMKRIEIDYQYQAKMEVSANFRIEENELNDLKSDLEREDTKDYIARIQTHDAESNLICEAKVFWQIKNWNAVKTRV